jgi:hypothetical protein
MFNYSYTFVFESKSMISAIDSIFYGIFPKYPSPGAALLDRMLLEA